MSHPINSHRFQVCVWARECSWFSCKDVRVEVVSLAQWANLATGAFLLFAPRNPYLGAAMYALADGPLAAALIAWQSAWVFNSAPHVIRCENMRRANRQYVNWFNCTCATLCLTPLLRGRSVLMHLLPGLAMYAHKHFPDPPATLRGLLRPSPSGSESESLSSAFHSRTPPGGVFWLFVMPMVFYLAWQFLYFLVVQVREPEVMVGAFHAAPEFFVVL